VKNHSIRNVFYVQILILNPPAQIDFFLMCKKIFVKTSESVKSFFSDKQTSSRSPKYFAYFVVLIFVFFDSRKNSSSAKRKSIFVDKTSRSTCIFKVFLVFVV